MKTPHTARLRGLSAALGSLCLAGCLSGGDWNEQTQVSQSQIDAIANQQLTLNESLQGFSGGFVAADGDATSYDLLVGAPGASNNRGAVLVYKDDASVISSTLQGEAAGDYFGSNVVALGNITGETDSNGKPKRYFAVGALWAEGDAPLSGAVYVYEKTATGATLKIKLKGEDALDKYSWAIASGDLDGDGIADIVVSAIQTANENPAESGFQAGKVYVYLSGAGNGIATGTPDVVFQGATGNGIGTALAIGDITGDGIADLIMGGSSVFVVKGRTGFKTAFDQSKTIAALADTKVSVGGESLAYLGDINGDGIGDFAIGAPKYGVIGGSYDNKGSVYLIKGCDGVACTYPAASTGISTTSATVTSSAFQLAKLIGAQEADRFGSALAWVGGSNKDLLVGARWAMGGSTFVPLEKTGNVYRYALNSFVLDGTRTYATSDAAQAYPITDDSGEYGRNVAYANGKLFAGAPYLHAHQGRAFRRLLAATSSSGTVSGSTDTSGGLSSGDHSGH